LSDYDTQMGTFQAEEVGTFLLSACAYYSCTSTSFFCPRHSSCHSASRPRRHMPSKKGTRSVCPHPPRGMEAFPQRVGGDAVEADGAEARIGRVCKQRRAAGWGGGGRRRAPPAGRLRLRPPRRFCVVAEGGGTGGESCARPVGGRHWQASGEGALVASW